MAKLLDNGDIWYAVMLVAEALRDRDLSFDAVGQVIGEHFGEHKPDIFRTE